MTVFQLILIFDKDFFIGMVLKPDRHSHHQQKSDKASLYEDDLESFEF